CKVPGSHGCKTRELVLCEANTVLKYSQEEGSQRGVYGKLICTNLKITFLCDEAPDDNVKFKNKIVGENDITLQCVDQLYGIYDDKKKVPIIAPVIRKYPERLIIYCKDFRVFHFCLTYTKEEEVKRVIIAAHHHIQSAEQQHYFHRTVTFTVLISRAEFLYFYHRCFLEMEADKRVTDLFFLYVTFLHSNKNHSNHFVVPVSLSEDVMFRFQGKGVPIGALDLVTSLFNTVNESSLHVRTRAMKPALLSPHSIEKTLHRPPYEEVRIEDLSAGLPSLAEIQAAYMRFKQLFLTDNSTDFWDTDLKWFSLLDTSNWLEIVRSCLKKTIEVIEYLDTQIINIVLKEDTGSDLCCVISSLVQIMMDPYYRTMHGFQSLVQKEWVMGGHRFLDRCNHLRKSESEAPVFLLFLDCVWQLVQQYPLAFGFSETYLTVLSDSINIPIFSTFFFNSPWEKEESKWAGEGRYRRSEPLRFYTVWDWSVQFELKALSFLTNPLYVEKSKQEKQLRKAQRSKHQRQLSLPLTPAKPANKKGFFRDETGPFIKNLLGKRISKLISASDEVPSNFRAFYENWHRKPVDFHGLILPHVDGPDISIWAQRHLRWIPEAQVLGGGNVATMQRILELTDEIQSLKKKVKERPFSVQYPVKEIEVDSRRKKSVRRSSLYPFAMLHISSFRPAIATTTWRSWDGEDDLVNREDELVDVEEVGYL
uniref:Myotubularin-related protein 12 n=1 Tax=Leptobrachium leishanense TaxID=445787 RepID=A0A8C5P739_9ANUR